MAEVTTIEKIKNVMQQTVDDMHMAMSIITIAQARLEEIYSDMTASLERVMQAKAALMGDNPHVQEVQGLERVMQAKAALMGDNPHVQEVQGLERVMQAKAALMEQGLNQFFNEYAQFSKELRMELSNIETAGLLLEDTLGEVALTIGIEPKAWNEKPGEEREC